MSELPSLQTVGHLYETIEARFDHLAAERAERRLFIGPPPAQATSAYFEMNDLVPVTDLASARDALQILTTQGEGVRGDWTEAHYGTFLAIRDELRQLQRSDPTFDPAWPSVDNPIDRPTEEVDDARHTVDSTATLQVMALFNSAYKLMTLRFFAHTDEPDAALRTLARSAVDLMEDVIEPLGTMLARMPAGATSDGPHSWRSVRLLPLGHPPSPPGAGLVDLPRTTGRAGRPRRSVERLRRVLRPRCRRRCAFPRCRRDHAALTRPAVISAPAAGR